MVTGVQTPETQVSPELQSASLVQPLVGGGAQAPFWQVSVGMQSESARQAPPGTARTALLEPSSPLLVPQPYTAQITTNDVKPLNLTGSPPGSSSLLAPGEMRRRTRTKKNFRSPIDRDTNRLEMFPRRAAPFFLGIAFLACFVASARAAELTLEGPLPFSEAQLAEALALRVPSAAKVRVRAADADAALASCGEKTRLVPLLGATGPAAARRIALAITDLLEPDLNIPLSALPEPSPVTATVAAIAAPPPRVVAAAVPPSIVPQEEPLSAITLLGGALGPARLSFSAAADISFAAFDSLSIFGGAGLIFTPPVESFGATLQSWRIPIRGGVGYRISAFEVRASAVATVHLLFAEDSNGDRYDRSEVLPGAGGSVLYYLPISRTVDFTAAAGADYFVLHRRFTVRAEPVFDTERVVIWGSAGVTFEALR